jgi:hypothetical protein
MDEQEQSWICRSPRMENASGGEAIADLRATAATNGAIEVTRHHVVWADRLREYHVFIDDRVGSVRDGESRAFRVPAGLHRVELRIDWAPSELRTVDVSAGDTVTLECRGRNPLAALYWITLGRNRYIQLSVVE